MARSHSPKSFDLFVFDVHDSTTNLINLPLLSLRYPPLWQSRKSNWKTLDFLDLNYIQQNNNERSAETRIPINFGLSRVKSDK